MDRVWVSSFPCEACAGRKKELVKVKAEVAVFEKGLVDRKYFEPTPTALTIKPGMPFEAWESLGTALWQVIRSAQWYIGEWINYGEREYGEKYSQALDQTRYTYGTLRQYSYVARNVHPSIRIDNLSFAHHQKVAHLKPEQQKHWLKLASMEDWPVHRLAEEIKGEAEKEEFELYCFISDKLECLARHYYNAFRFASKPKKGKYEWDPDWDSSCIGNCPCYGFCKDMIRDAQSFEKFKDLTISINRRRLEKIKRERGSKK